MRARTYYDLPSPSQAIAGLFVVVCAVALLRSAFAGGDFPMLLPLLAAAVSALSLLLVGRERDPCQTFMRVGFHLGTFAFFLLFPLTSASQVGPNVSSEVRSIVGYALLLGIVGFEAGYWGTRLTSRSGGLPATAFSLRPSHEQALKLLVGFGLLAWFLTIVDLAVSGGVPIVDVLLTMRAPVEGADRSASTFFSGRLVIMGRLLDGGVLLAGTAASVLLTLERRRSRVVAIVCWVTLLMAGLAGFLTGSRAVFFYSFCPLVATAWLRLCASPRARSVRWMWAGVAALLLLTAWGAMTALRGADIRSYERGWEAMVPTVHAKGTLDIYSDMAVVIQAFPELLPYQQGRSLLPLVLGWVPRAVWPEKPYPFTLFMNFLNGETLENRTMSIAVGLVGEGYGNFGLLGVFLWSGLMGLACRRGDDYVGRYHPLHPLRLQLAAMAGIWSALIVRGGVPEMFYMGLSLLLPSWALSRYLYRAEVPLEYVRPALDPGPAGPPPSLRWSV
jgi:hypothetical protein